nr:hypothetical protein [Pseudomonas fulva]
MVNGVLKFTSPRFTPASFANAKFGLRPGLPGRRASVQVDRPGRAATPPGGTLRAALHLDSLKVGEIAQGHPRTPEVDLVQVHPDAAFQTIVETACPQAANPIAGIPRVGLGKQQRRYPARQLPRAVQPGGFQRPGVQRGLAAHRWPSNPGWPLGLDHQAIERNALGRRAGLERSEQQQPRPRATRVHQPFILR